MQTIIGRLVANAEIKELKDGRKLVTFTIAQNDRFKVKTSDEVKQVTNFFNCSYWIATGIAKHLKKGQLVEVIGRIGVDAWKDMDGDVRARLTLHVQYIQLHGKTKTLEAQNETTTSPKTETSKADLPF